MPRSENGPSSFKAKAFFRGEQWKEVFVFLFFVLLAVGFWLLQSLQQEYEIKLSFPVRYRNMPVDIAFDTPAPERIIARVKDKGSVLLNYTFGHSFAPIEVNMKDAKAKNGSILVDTKEIEADIQRQLIATTSLNYTTPSQIELTFSQRIHKEIPIVFDGNIQLVAGYQLAGDIQITPAKVNAYATVALLDSISEIRTAYVEIKKANKNIIRNIQLVPVKGVNLDPVSVSVMIPVEEFTEKTLEVPVLCDRPDVRYTARIFPSTVKVTCSVPLSRFMDLSADMFEIRVPYEELERNMSGSIPVTLTKKPSWVRNATLFPDKIEFILEYNNRHD